MNAFIVHICSRQTWLAAQQRGVYRPEDTAEKASFIHACRPEQALGVANAWFSGASDLVLLWIDPERVQPVIRWEAADAETFPHIYGSLNLDAVIAVRPFAADGDGVFRKDVAL